jgi:hypothetical protein
MAGAAPTEETVYIAGDKIVTQSSTVRTIVDLDKKTITSADMAKKAYFVTSFDELQAQMDMIRKSLDSLPPEQRKQMGALLDDTEPDIRRPARRNDRRLSAKGSSAAALRRIGVDGCDREAGRVPWKGIERRTAARLGEAMGSRVSARTRIDMKAGAQTVTLSNEVSR